MHENTNETNYKRNCLWHFLPFLYRLPSKALSTIRRVFTAFSFQSVLNVRYMYITWNISPKHGTHVIQLLHFSTIRFSLCELNYYKPQCLCNLYRQYLTNLTGLSSPSKSLSSRWGVCTLSLTASVRVTDTVTVTLEGTVLGSTETTGR